MTSIIGDFRWTKRRHLGVALLGIAAIVALVGIRQKPAQAAPINVVFDLASAIPSSYDHATGGGAWNDGKVAQGSVRAEHSAVDFACGDIQSFFLAVTTDTSVGLTGGGRTMQIDLVWDAASEMFPGAGYTDIVRAQVNYGPVSGGAGPNGQDTGIRDDGGSTASIAAESLTGAFVPGGKLHGAIEITDVEPNEQIIVRIDVRLSCKTNADRAGILYAVVDQDFNHSGAREISPEPRDLQVGQLRQQLVQVALLANADYTATLTPNPSSLVAPGGPVTYTVSIHNNLPTHSLLIEEVTDTYLGPLSQAGAATTCVLPWQIPASQTKTCTFTGVVSGAANTSLTNTIVAVGGGSTRSADATVSLTADPHIRIVKSVQSSLDNDSSGGYSAGDVLTFALTATNTGNVGLTGVVVSDTLPGTSPVNCGAFNGTLAIGIAITCTTTYTISAPDGQAGEVTNTAVADSVQTPPVATSITVRLAGPAVLTVTVTTSPAGPFKVGDDVTVKIDVCNTGGSTMTGVTVKEPSLAVDQSLGSINNGACKQVTKIYKVSTTDALNAQHAFQGTANSDQSGPKTAVASVAVAAIRSLAIVVTTPVTAVEEGTVITYTVKVTNNSDVPLGTVVVSDSFGGLNEMLAGMTVGEVKTFTVTHTPTSAEVTAAKVVYSASAAASNAALVSDGVTVTVTAKPAPKVTTTTTPAPPAPIVTTRIALPVTGAAHLQTSLILALALAAAGLALLVGGRRREIRA